MWWRLLLLPEEMQGGLQVELPEPSPEPSVYIEGTAEPHAYPAYTVGLTGLVDFHSHIAPNGLSTPLAESRQ